MQFYGRMMRMARKYWWHLFFTVLALIGTAALNLVTPEIVRRLTEALTDGSVTEGLLIGFAGILVGAYLLKGFLRFISLYVGHIAAWSFVGDMIAAVYDKLQELSLRYFGDKQTGELMSRASNDTRLLEVLIAHALPDLFSNLCVVVGVAVMIFLIHPLLALLTIIPVPFLILLNRMFSHKVAPMFRRNLEMTGELNAMLQDNLSGLKEIKAFGREDTESRRLGAFAKDYADTNIRANFAAGIFHPSVEFFVSLGTVILVGFGGWLVMRGRLSTADLIGFFMYLNLFYLPLSVLARLAEDINMTRAGGERVLELLDAPVEIADAPDAAALDRVSGRVEFANVSFRYTAEEAVLDDISFTAQPGEMIALVGATGVGKTTIFSLLERFYDPDSGTILLDGTDIRTATLTSLRANLSLVLQDVFLFNGTIAENIAYGLEGATREQIKQAAVIASADAFISTLPNGYDTLTGERGARLSGGQKQRIAIARAVLRNAPVLLLDEATSAIDTETEAEISRAIERLTGSRTILVIAHRLSTVRRADRILVIDQGKIAEQGTHEQLLAKKGLYAALYNVQG